MLQRLLLLLFVGFMLLSVTLRVQAAGEVDQSSYEAEDFEVQEDGVMFDTARTGLMYRRNQYELDENRTFLSQQPTAYNDTTEAKPWTIYISHWELAPPSIIDVFIKDDTPYQDYNVTVDVQVRLGQADRAGNMIVANGVIYRDIPIEKGITRVPLPIHNYAGDIVSIFIVGVRQKLRYHAIEF